MKVKVIFLLAALVSLLLVQEASSSCGCGAPCKDLCHCTPIIVRPKPRPPPPPARKICECRTYYGGYQPFYPIGDRCHCDLHCVEPAPLPIPARCNRCEQIYYGPRNRCRCGRKSRPKCGGCSCGMLFSPKKSLGRLLGGLIGLNGWKGVNNGGSCCCRKPSCNGGCRNRIYRYI